MERHEFDELTSPYAEVREGNPLGYLPATALPPVCSILSSTDILEFKVTGSLIPNPKGEGYLLEITKVSLLR